MIAHDLALALVRYDALYAALKPRMSLTALIVMAALEDGKTHAAARVQEKTGLSQNVVRDVVHRLVAKGFVRRTTLRACNAGRPTLVTPAGAAAFEECRALVRRVDGEFFRGCTGNTRRDFESLLSSLAKTT